jgi:hypothetical protein
VTIPLTCRCGKEFDVHEKFAGKRFPCPACKEPVEVPLRIARAAPAPPAREAAVRTGPPPLRPRAAKPPPPPPAQEPASSPMQRFFWLWLLIAAVVPVAVVSLAFASYLLLRRPTTAVVAEQGDDKQQAAAQAVLPPAKFKLKANVHPQAKAPAQPKNEAQALDLLCAAAAPVSWPESCAWGPP